MLNFFKNFGKGILYVLVLPVLLVILVLYAVFALFGFIYLTIKGIILFFTGRSLFDDLPEDKKAKAIIKANTINPDDYVSDGDKPYVEEDNSPKVEVVSRDIYMNEQPSQEDPFYVPEYLKPEEEKPIIEEEPVQEVEELVTPEDIVYNKEEPVEEKLSVEREEQEEDIPYVHQNYQNDEIDIGDEEDEWDGDSGNLRL